MKKNLTYILGMCAATVAFICALLFLNALDDWLQISIVALTVLLFCFLGAKLLVNLSISHKYSSKGIVLSESTIQRDSKIQSIADLIDELCKVGYVFKGNLEFEAGNIKFFQRISKDKGIFLSNVFTMDTLPSTVASDFGKLDKVLHTAMLNSEKEQHLKIVKERSTILCAVIEKEGTAKIQELIKKADYTFSFFLPIVVAMDSESVYHSSIPINQPFAKGKALVRLSKMVSAVFYR